MGLCNFIIPAQGGNKIDSPTGTSTSSNIQAQVEEAYGSVFAFSTGELLPPAELGRAWVEVAVRSSGTLVGDTVFP